MGLGSREREGEDPTGQARGGAGVTAVRARQCPAGRGAGGGGRADAAGLQGGGREGRLAD